MHSSLRIFVLAKTALAIMATVVLVMVIGNVLTGRPELLNAALNIGVWVIIAIILVALLINLPRALPRR